MDERTTMATDRDVILAFRLKNIKKRKAACYLVKVPSVWHGKEYGAEVLTERHCALERETVAGAAVRLRSKADLERRTSLTHNRSRR